MGASVVDVVDTTVDEVASGAMDTAAVVDPAVVGAVFAVTETRARRRRNQALSAGVLTEPAEAKWT